MTSSSYELTTESWEDFIARMIKDPYAFSKEIGVTMGVTSCWTEVFKIGMGPYEAMCACFYYCEQYRPLTQDEYVIQYSLDNRTNFSQRRFQPKDSTQILESLVAEMIANPVAFTQRMGLPMGNGNCNIMLYVFGMTYPESLCGCDYICGMFREMTPEEVAIQISISVEGFLSDSRYVLNYVWYYIITYGVIFLMGTTGGYLIFNYENIHYKISLLFGL